MLFFRAVDRDTKRDMSFANYLMLCDATATRSPTSRR